MLNVCKVYDNRPATYYKVDSSMSRSAQPSIINLHWLKEQGVTDVINFRTYKVCDLDFSEKEVVEGLNMRYHPLPSITRHPTMKNVETFLDITKNIKKAGGKGHWHCMAGVDRTGMYTFIYEMMNGIGDIRTNIAKWKAYGFNYVTYPHLERWAKCCVERLSRLK